MKSIIKYPKIIAIIIVIALVMQLGIYDVAIVAFAETQTESETQTQTEETSETQASEDEYAVMATGEVSDISDISDETEITSFYEEITAEETEWVYAEPFLTTNRTEYYITKQAQLYEAIENINTEGENGTAHVLYIAEDIAIDKTLEITDMREITIMAYGQDVTISATTTDAMIKMGFSSILNIGGGESSEHAITLNGNDKSESVIQIGAKENYTSYLNIYANSVITGGNAQNGGGVFANYANIKIYGGEITGNTAKNGGGIYVGENTSLKIYGGKIASNEATANGGAIYISDGEEFYMTAGEISENSAENGGGIYFENATPHISENIAIMFDYVITNNSATNGGGIYVASGTLVVDGGEITSNSASSGGGIYVASGAQLQHFMLSETPFVYGLMEVYDNDIITFEEDAFTSNVDDLESLVYITFETTETKEEIETTSDATEAELDAVDITEAKTISWQYTIQNNTATITYQETYQESTPWEVSHLAGTDIAKISTPTETQDGVFKYWSKNEDGTGEIYYVGQQFVIETDLTLYPIWEANTATYNENDNTWTDENFSNVFTVKTEAELRSAVSACPTDGTLAIIQIDGKIALSATLTISSGQNILLTPTSNRDGIITNQIDDEEVSTYTGRLITVSSGATLNIGDGGVSGNTIYIQGAVKRDGENDNDNDYEDDGDIIYYTVLSEGKAILRYGTDESNYTYERLTRDKLTRVEETDDAGITTYSYYYVDSGELFDESEGEDFEYSIYIYYNTSGLIISSGTLNIFDNAVLEYGKTVSYGGGINNASGCVLTMYGGKISDNVTTNRGGGIINYGTFLFYDGIITNNQAGYSSGGVYNCATTSEMLMFGGEISYNSSTYEGGGIMNAGTLTIFDGEISNNTSPTGGGIFSSSTEVINIYDCTISYNVATNGGGIRSYVFVVLYSGVISNNKSSNHGGGIYGTTRMYGGVISNNTAGSNGGGGGIYGSTTMYGGEISNNTANGGGGINGKTTMYDGIVSNNTSFGSSGGIYSSSTVTFYDGIVSNNNATANGGGISGTVTFYSGEVINNTSSSNGGGINGVTTVYAGIISNNIAVTGGGINNTTTMYGGLVSNNKVGYRGGGISGTTKMYAGIVSNNKASNYGGGIYSTTTMYGGVISNNTSGANGGGISGITTMYDGEISYNTSSSNGGGINGDTTMYDGEISNNISGANGGGISGITIMYDGEISYNIASTYGGGIHGNTTMYDGSVSNNTASSIGGGIFSYSIMMYGGKISDNYSKASVGGIYTSTISEFYGGVISGNTAESGVGGVYIHKNSQCSIENMVYIYDNWKVSSGDLVASDINLSVPIDESMQDYFQIIQTGSYYTLEYYQKHKIDSGQDLMYATEYINWLSENLDEENTDDDGLSMKAQTFELHPNEEAGNVFSIDESLIFDGDITLSIIPVAGSDYTIINDEDLEKAMIVATNGAEITIGGEIVYETTIEEDGEEVIEDEPELISDTSQEVQNEELTEETTPHVYVIGATQNNGIISISNSSTVTIKDNVTIAGTQNASAVTVEGGSEGGSTFNISGDPIFANEGNDVSVDSTSSANLIDTQENITNVSIPSDAETTIVYNKYTVTYIKNNSLATGSDFTSEETTILDVNDGTYFFQAGYVVDHWNTTSDDVGTSYKTGDTIDLSTKNMILYAQWDVADFTITYITNYDVSKELESNDQVYGYEIEEQPTAERDNYTFVGWNTAEDGSGDYYAEGDISYISSDSPLYAQWQITTSSGMYVGRNYTSTTENTSSHNIAYNYAISEYITFEEKEVLDTLSLTHDSLDVSFPIGTKITVVSYQDDFASYYFITVDESNQGGVDIAAAMGEDFKTADKLRFVVDFSDAQDNSSYVNGSVYYLNFYSSTTTDGTADIVSRSFYSRTLGDFSASSISTSGVMENSVLDISGIIRSNVYNTYYDEFRHTGEEITIKVSAKSVDSSGNESDAEFSAGTAIYCDDVAYLPSTDGAIYVPYGNSSSISTNDNATFDFQLFSNLASGDYVIYVELLSSSDLSNSLHEMSADFTVDDKPAVSLEISNQIITSDTLYVSLKLSDYFDESKNQDVESENQDGETVNQDGETVNQEATFVLERKTADGEYESVTLEANSEDISSLTSDLSISIPLATHITDIVSYRLTATVDGYSDYAYFIYVHK